METERTSEKKRKTKILPGLPRVADLFFSRWYIQSPSAPNKLTGAKSTWVWGGREGGRCQPILSSIKVWSINKKFLHFSPAAKCTPCSYIGTQKTFQLCLGEFFNQTINLICLNNHSLLTLSLSLSLSIVCALLCWWGLRSTSLTLPDTGLAWPRVAREARAEMKSIYYSWQLSLTDNSYSWVFLNRKL